MELVPLKRYRGMRVCVALSGGVDSVSLLHAFYACQDEYGITLTAAHVEHGIRGEESLRDCAFCEALCAKWNIPLTVRHADVPRLAAESGRGIEETARAVRYDFFQSLLDENKADAVATAHHEGDVAETVLFRLARGTSLAGMRAVTERDGIIRPLLTVPRAQIEAYARQNGLSFVEDSTNSDENYSRNYIRHTVLPAFDGISEHATEHLARFAARAAEDDDFLQTLADREIIFRAGEAMVPISLPDPLFFRACLRCMQELGIERDYIEKNLREVSHLRAIQSGKRATLPSGKQAIREQEYIVFYDPQSDTSDVEQKFFGHTVSEPFHLTEGDIRPSEHGAGTLHVDLDAFPEGCVVRTRREGDYITPFGGGRKPLKKFLTDRKISARQGRKLPLIACGSEVLVVVGVEISEKVKITQDTKRFGSIF